MFKPKIQNQQALNLSKFKLNELIQIKFKVQTTFKSKPKLKNDSKSKSNLNQNN